MVGAAAVKLEGGKAGFDDRQSAGDTVESAKSRLSENDVMTYAELCARLNLPKRTVERLVSKSQIPHRKIGKRCVRFYWPAIEAWLLDQKGAKAK